MSENSYPHRSVLPREALRILQPASGKTFIDGTLGAGGHTEMLLEASAPDGKVIAFDLDPKAIEISKRRLNKFGDRVQLVLDSYANAPKYIKKKTIIHGVLLDLGVSSMQIDTPERGFSFLKTGPLDMRFGNKGQSAHKIINQASEEELAQIFWEYGEERGSRKAAAAIVKARKQATIETTTQLADIIASAIRSNNIHIHPATRCFQALRIAVNDELNTLTDALPKLTSLLSAGGRIAVISFHSLEDRIVKNFFRKEATDCLCPPRQPICTCNHKAQLRIVNARIVSANEDEIKENIRSRSAKLRAAEKLESRRA